MNMEKIEDFQKDKNLKEKHDLQIVEDESDKIIRSPETEMVKNTDHVNKEKKAQKSEEQNILTQKKIAGIYNIVGKNIDKPGIKNIANQILDNRLVTPTEKKRNEVEKTEEDIKEIKEVEGRVNQELIKLGLEPDFKISPKDVHILLRKRNVLKFPAGYVNQDQKGINLIRENGKTLYVELAQKFLSFISKNKSTAMDDSHVYTHESIHEKSYHKYRIRSQGDGSRMAVNSYRIGYDVSSSYKNGNFKEALFEGFNEAVVEATTVDIVNQKNKERGIEAVIETPSHYKFNIDIADKIAEKVAEVKGETKEDVWIRFKKEQFTGNMMHLRDVEQAFGADSLRVLASMDALTPFAVKPLYKLYFSTNSKIVKNITANLIFFRKRVARYIRETFRL